MCLVAKLSPKSKETIKLFVSRKRQAVDFLDRLGLKPIAECHDVKLTGNFLSKVFEGSYKNMKKWVKEMDEYVKSKGKETKRNYFFYPTCPKCSKKYGKNYVVILAEI